MSTLVNKKPKSIKLATMEIICTALDCDMSDFCEIHPSKAIRKKSSKIRQLSRSTTPISKRGVAELPNPDDY